MDFGEIRIRGRIAPAQGGMDAAACGPSAYTSRLAQAIVIGQFRGSLAPGGALTPRQRP